ncbi:MAG: hypothetical protein ABSB96_07955 [Gaiellaceae bacterium]
MRARLTKLVVAVAAFAALAVGGSVYASGAHKASPPAAPAVSQSQQESSSPAEVADVQQGDQSAPDNAGAAENATVDTDNVQQGDQSGIDQATGAEASSTGEEATSESDQSDGPGGYADVNPNADTQQQGEH